MKIISIFANQLFAFHYKDEPLDTFHNTFNDWTDMEYLFDFFEANKEDFIPGYHGKDIDSTIISTQQRAMNFQRKLVGEARVSGLDEIFKPLHIPGVKTNRAFEENKAYGSGQPSILRIYALKLGRGIYVVTGGAIKLTDNMQGEHLTRELRKLKMCQDFLKSQGVTDIEGFNELIY